jgi:hypothetical protein
MMRHLVLGGLVVSAACTWTDSHGDDFSNPRITVDPVGLSFEPTALLDSSAARFGIGNTGGDDLFLYVICVVGDSSFAVSPEVRDGDLPVSVAPGALYTIEVTFRPLFCGPSSAEVVVRSNSVAHPLLHLPLQGTGIGNDCEQVRYCWERDGICAPDCAPPDPDCPPP